MRNDTPPVRGEGEEEEEVDEEEEAAAAGPSFSADCTRCSRGDLGGSALLGRGRATGGDECSLAGKTCVVLELPTVWPASGGGDEVVGEGV